MEVDHSISITIYSRGSAMNSNSKKDPVNENVSEVGRDQENDALSQFDLAFIHQVLLTDDPSVITSSLVSLPTIGPDNRNATLSFEEFEDRMNHDNLDGLDRDMVVKKAARDHICESIAPKSDNYGLARVQGLLLELHNKIRGLIPNRPDLHSILDDEGVKHSSSLSEVQAAIEKAAQSLENLESEARGETTRKMLEILRINHSGHETEDSDFNLRNGKFLTTVIVYLLYKAELCEADKQDFYMQNVWAPKIYRDGPATERKHYQVRFGEFSDPKSSPLTREWIRSLFQSEGKENGPRTTARLLLSTEARKDFVRAGWVEDILFRNSKQESLDVPEILSHDTNRMRTIRDACRMAVAGCALALHACNVSGANSQEVLIQKSEINQEKRLELLEKINNDHRQSSLQYESGVCGAVEALAQTWNSSLTEAACQSLKSRTVAVLRGEDPVLNLFSNRIKETMRDALLENLTNKKNTLAVPTAMRAGKKLPKNNKGTEADTTNTDLVETLFCRRGLAFFAPELAGATRLAGKVIDLAIHLYWVDLLDRIVLDACRLHS